MLNKITVAPSREYFPYTKTVIEKRAPTDDSIRLYDEIKEKAYKSILKTIELNDNTFNLNAILYNEWSSNHNVCQYRFTLNGKEFTGEIKSSNFNLGDKSVIYRKIFEGVAQTITTQIMATAFNNKESEV
jgi:hypothetical protein